MGRSNWNKTAFKKIKDFEERLNKYGSGSWDNAEYYFDEKCCCCGYESIKYAKEHGITLDEFENDLDDYDGFRWEQTNTGLFCEACIKEEKIRETINHYKECGAFWDVIENDRQGIVDVYITNNETNKSYVIEIVGEDNFRIHGNWIVVNFDYEELIECDFVEDLAKKIKNNHTPAHVRDNDIKLTLDDDSSNKPAPSNAAGQGR